jgi:putative membrane protein
MRFVYWTLVALAAALLAVFAVSNRESVALGLWPLPFAIDLPLYLLVLLPLLAGFLAGKFAGWIAGARRRRELRHRRRRIGALERELAATQSLLDGRTPTLPSPAGGGRVGA